MEQFKFRPGHNCWQLARAERLGFLIDGAAYFAAFRDSLTRAQRSIGILAWDVDSRLRLLEQADDALPLQLGEFLDALVSHRRRLRAHVLSWDFSVLMAGSRELLPLYKLDWRTHRRMRFRMDGSHPLGACHHQKVVVIDRRIAYVGGLDLTLGRWDTPRHRRREPLRRDADGTDLRPYHDVQVVLDGAAAEALATLFEARWQGATGRAMRLDGIDRDDRANAHDDPWPAGQAVALREIDVAVARTAHGTDGTITREVERLYTDSIAAAQRHIFIENQYLSSPSIGAALSRRLEQADGPEVIIVQPLRTDGWLSQNTMDVLRARQVAALGEADRHGRLGIYYPHAPGLDDAPINVHAKVMVIDDCFVRVGSSNLCNRSLTLDSECDVAALAPPGSDNARAIATFRQHLLANHLGVEVAALDTAERQHGSLLAAIEALRGGTRTLEVLPAEARPERRVDIRDPGIADPEAPLEPARLLAHFVPEPPPASVAPAIRRGAVLVAIVTALAALWHWTPLAELTDATAMADWLAGLREVPGLPLMVVAGFIVAGLLMVPLTALVTATVLALGPMTGFLCSLSGALASAMLSYALGASLGRHTIRRLAGARLNAVSERLARRGVLTVSVLRLMPVAPFTVVNLVAGASHLRFRDYVLGTLIGMTPGLLGLVLLVDGTLRVLREPGPRSAVLLLVSVAVIAAAGWLLWRWLHARQASQATPGD